MQPSFLEKPPWRGQLMETLTLKYNCAFRRHCNNGVVNFVLIKGRSESNYIYYTSRTICRTELESSLFCLEWTTLWILMYNVILKAKPGLKQIFVPKLKQYLWEYIYKRFFVSVLPGKNKRSSHICEILLVYLLGFFTGLVLSSWNMMTPEFLIFIICFKQGDRYMCRLTRWGVSSQFFKMTTRNGNCLREMRLKAYGSFIAVISKFCYWYK